MMKFGMLSASVLLMALTGCTTHASDEDVGDAPGSWVNSGGSGPSGTGGSGPSATGGSGPVATGGGPVAGGATGTGGYATGGTAGAGGESADCNQIVAECYSQAYACCGQGVDEQCEMMAGTCASIICPDPYPYPLQCSDYIVPVDEGTDEIQAFELAVNTCSSLGLTATSAELLDLGVFVTCCPDPSGGGIGTGGTSWGTGGYAGEPGMGTGAGGYSMGGAGGDETTGAGGYSMGGTGVGGIGVGGTGMGGTGVVIPGFCSGVGGEGGYAGAGGTGMGGYAGEDTSGGFAGEGGFATGGTTAD